VDRDEVQHSVDAFGVDLEEHVQFVIEAMRGVAGELGLEGEKDPS
jgi:predicted hydrolase (HD superfamily)